MDKLKKKFQNLPLKKSLLLVSAVCLSTVCILSAVTILFFSGMRQRLLDLRPVIITDYVLESSDADTGGSTSCRRNTATEHCREINSSSAGARPF